MGNSQRRWLLPVLGSRGRHGGVRKRGVPSRNSAEALNFSQTPYDRTALARALRVLAGSQMWLHTAHRAPAPTRSIPAPPTEPLEDPRIILHTLFTSTPSHRNVTRFPEKETPTRISHVIKEDPALRPLTMLPRGRPCQDVQHRRSPTLHQTAKEAPDPVHNTSVKLAVDGTAMSSCESEYTAFMFDEPSFDRPSFRSQTLSAARPMLRVDTRSRQRLWTK